jgi:hypothetical protein
MSIFVTQHGRKGAILGQSKIFKHALNVDTLFNHRNAHLMNPFLTRIGLFIACCSLAISGISQGKINCAPGGVTGALRWYELNYQSGVASFKSNLDHQASIVLDASASVGWINHRPALLLNGRSEFSINLDKVDLSKATYFTVYQSQNPNKEQLIWNIEKNNQPNLVLTTSRVADLEYFQYMNFTDLVPTAPKINVYGQQKNQDSLPILRQKWQLGSVPLSPQLPVENFVGIIPELIVFDRVLDREERHKVASYLALKYGITLTENSTTYHNSQGEMLWKGASYPTFHHNIAGLGRDDAAGFVQKQASSSNVPNLLAAAFSGTIENGHFLMWGDNDLPLSPAPKTAGMPTLLQRKWLFARHGNTTFSGLEISLDTKQVFAEVPANPVYWMLIDSTGKGEFRPKDVQFIKMQGIDAKGFAHFKVPHLTPFQQKSNLAFVLSQNLLLSTDISQPTCDAPKSGQMQVKIIGGEAPYRLLVENKTLGQAKEYHLKAEQQLKDLEGLSAGKYLLRLVDSRQEVYIDSFIINPKGAPLSPVLASEYVLNPGKSLKIDAAANIPTDITYRWQGPADFESSGPILQTARAGIYTLTSSLGSCSATQEIEVLDSPVSIFSAEVVYPNPSNGLFNVKVVLNKPSVLNLSVFSAEGKLILSKKASGSDHYTFSDQLTSNGVHYIVLRAGKAVSTHKLLVIN